MTSSNRTNPAGRPSDGRAAGAVRGKRTGSGLLVFILVAMFPGPAPLHAAGRRVVFVDSVRGVAGGNGTFDHPLVTLSEAQASSMTGDVIFVAEALKPYEGGIALKEGQMLVGSAYGLDAVRVDLKIELDAPLLPAAAGAGPIIHGTIMLPGNNIVAGVSVAVDGGSGIVAYSPKGPVSLVNVFFRPSRGAVALFIRDNTENVSISGGAIDGVSISTGVVISGGRGDILVERFPISGTFSRAVIIRDRIGGSITFRNKSTIAVDDSSGDAVTVEDCDGAVSFESPVRLATHGGRGVVVSRSKKVSFSGGVRIDSTNAAAVEIHDSLVEGALQSVSARAVAPGHLIDGVVLDKLRGHLVIAPPEGEHDSGTIRGAARSGMTISQSAGVKITGLTFIENGADRETKCDEDVAGKTNLLCRAALFLRHVTDSELAELTIQGGGQVGINANNVSGLRMSGIHINGVGKVPFEAGMVIDEVIGEVRLSGSGIENNGGGGLVIEQRYNDGRVIVDGCTIDQTARPELAAFLIRAHTAGQGKLALELRHCDLHDNAGSGVALQSDGRSAVAFSLADSSVERLGGLALDVSAKENSRAVVALHNVQVIAPGVRARPLISMRMTGTPAESPRGCVDLSGNRFVTSGGGAPVVDLAVVPVSGALQVVGQPAAPDAKAIAAFLERINPGATVRIEVSDAGAILAVERCQ
jgi:hypothetical protein